MWHWPDISVGIPSQILDGPVKYLYGPIKYLTGLQWDRVEGRALVLGAVSIGYGPVVVVARDGGVRGWVAVCRGWHMTGVLECVCRGCARVC